MKVIERFKGKSLCVTQRGNKYYYPPSIPRERSNLIRNSSILICLFLILVDYLTNNLDMFHLLVYYACSFVVNVVFHLIYRILLIFEECKHAKSRYENNYKTIIEDAMCFPKKAKIFIVICIFAIIYGRPGLNQLANFNKNSLICLATTFLLGKVFELDSSPLNSSLQITQINGLDYGSGMAYSFFNGYLKLIMQKSGNEDKNLRDLMEIYEGEHGVKFREYKLFILIPISLRCFVSLQNDFFPTVEESISLREKQITVAGVQNRVYKNAVYKINCHDNSKVYVVAEYATPLKTFHDVVNSSGDHAVYYRKHKNEICLQFYLTLKRVLKDSKFDECCELIFFEDSYQCNGGTYYYDVGEILLSRMRDLKKQKSKLE